MPIPPAHVPTQVWHGFGGGLGGGRGGGDGGGLGGGEFISSHTQKRLPPNHVAWQFELEE